MHKETPFRLARKERSPQQSENTVKKKYRKVKKRAEYAPLLASFLHF